MMQRLRRAFRRRVLTPLTRPSPDAVKRRLVKALDGANSTAQRQAAFERATDTLFHGGRRGRPTELAALRELPLLANSRPELAMVSRLAARADQAFNVLTAKGDAAREGCAWAVAASFYAEALVLYPAHAGFQIQLGHMRKEASDWTGAEIAYRDALTCCAPPEHVLQHLAFCISRSAVPPVAADFLPPGSDCPTSSELQSLRQLLLGRLAYDDRELVASMRAFKSGRDAARTWLASNEFAYRAKLDIEQREPR